MDWVRIADTGHRVVERGPSKRAPHAFERFDPVEDVDNADMGPCRGHGAGEDCIDKVYQSLHFKFENSARIGSSRYGKHRDCGNCHT